MISPKITVIPSTPQPGAIVSPESIAAKERRGHRLLPKSCFYKHKCEARCEGCRKKFRVCPEDRCFLARPRDMWCQGCSQVANERWLKGWPNKLAPCPHCWTVSFCAGMTLEGSMVHCRCCGYRWPQSGVPWHKDAEAMGFRDPQ